MRSLVLIEVSFLLSLPEGLHVELEARQAFDPTARLCSFPGRGDRVDEFFFDALPHDLFCLRSGQGRLGVGCFP